MSDWGSSISSSAPPKSREKRKSAYSSFVHKMDELRDFSHRMVRILKNTTLAYRIELQRQAVILKALLPFELSVTISRRRPKSRPPLKVDAVSFSKSFLLQFRRDFYLNGT